jgi:hypothetical protein
MGVTLNLGIEGYIRRMEAYQITDQDRIQEAEVCTEGDSDGILG